MRWTHSFGERRAALAAWTLLALVCLPARAAVAQSTARELYNRALALERALASPPGSRSATPSATDARRVIAAYELVVRRFPKSGYCDNALWQAGQLALQTARRHGTERDRSKGIALLQWLVREYPTSRQVGPARELIARSATMTIGSVGRAAPPAAGGPPPAPRASAPAPRPAADEESAPQQLLWARALWFQTPVPLVPTASIQALGTTVVPPLPDGTLTPAAAASGSPPAPASPAASPAARSGATGPASSPPGKAVGPAPPAVPGAAASNSTGGYSLARQLGLGVARIVIDPGHGGHDPGAKANGTTEAQIVLDVALRMEAILKKDPLIEVVLTRRTDVFVPLEERTAMANRVRADLFVSVHANASRNPASRGVETYYLNFASNPDAEAVAARENATSAKTMASLPEIVKAITLNTKLDESRDLAGHVPRAVVGRLKGAQPGLRDLGVKQAPFVVLIGATMPSILAEISFVTNKGEANLLRTPSYRQRIAESIIDGIRRYQATLKTARTGDGG